MSDLEVFQRPRAPKRSYTADETAAAELRHAAEELRERAARLAAVAQSLDPFIEAKITDDPDDFAGVFDQAVEAVAKYLETGITHYTWNGNPRRPHNYRAAAADARTTPNPYRKA
jgi:hypothetical protein